MRLRPLEDDDLPLLHRWLHEPGVVRWWEGEDVSWQAVVRDHRPGTSDPVQHRIGEVGGRPVGWIQCYPTGPFEDEVEVRAWRRLGVHPRAAGIDYLVGEPGLRGRGIGAAMIRACVERVVLGADFVAAHRPTAVCASPYEANVASWRALAAAGFVHRGTWHEPEGRVRLMVRDLTT